MYQILSQVLNKQGSHHVYTHRVGILMGCTKVKRLFICERHLQEFGNRQPMELYIVAL